MQYNTSLPEDGEALSSAHDVTELASRLESHRCDGVIPESSPKWFAAYTTPRHEKAVVRQFEARQIESFLPLYRSVRRRRNGCRVAVDEPLFPSYVFVHIRRRDSVKVLQMPGVVSIVSAGREPAPLCTDEIESLRAGLAQRRFEPHPYLVAGEKVRIVSGALAGMTGVLLRRKNEYRVVMTVDLIRQSVSVEIGVDEIEPLQQ